MGCRVHYFSMFSGIGGFEYGIGDMGECIGYSEIDKYAEAIYRYHYLEHKGFGDATEINTDELPDFDLLVGGFPCQSFSIAGKRKGLSDSRGTLFFEIVRICADKRPGYILLENVKGLLSHSDGKTFQSIIGILSDIGYLLQWQVLNSKFFGVPQNRERVFIIGIRKDIGFNPIFPLGDYNDIYESITRNESVYMLSQDFSKDTGILLLGLPQGEREKLPRKQMQEMFIRIKQEISRGESYEIKDESEATRQDRERGLQEVETINTWTQGIDNSRGLSGVVQIPTEKMLLLWARGGSSSASFGQIQQQNIPFECGQNRLIEGIREGEYGSLLLAVQPYQGRLFYSIGNGRDWQNIYIQEVGTKCQPKLSYILEEQPDPKYFLSESQRDYLMERVKRYSWDALVANID